MTILIFKNEFVSKVGLGFLCLALLFFFFVLFYNQNSQVLAQEQEGEPSSLLCGQEIPSGEALDKAGELLVGLMVELAAINEKAYLQIKTAEEMMELSQQCDLGDCQPVCTSRSVTIPFCNPNLYCGTTCPPGKVPVPLRDCQDIPIPPCPGTGGVSACCAEECSQIICEPQPCQGQACPQEDIDAKFSEIDKHYNSIKESKEKIRQLIGSQTESLCEKTNEDIRTWSERARCSETICLPGCELSKKEVIKRKLDKARAELDKCYVPPSDWEKMTKGQVAVKLAMSCELVEGQGLSRETKTLKEMGGELVPVCTSPHNWFCCSGP